MENKINIAELLRNCPQGMELDCTVFDNIVFDSVSNLAYPIKVITKDGSKSLTLTKYGCTTSENKNAKCVIFPKGKTTWEGFVPPIEFKDGDILYTQYDCDNVNGYIFIFESITENTHVNSYLHLLRDELRIVKVWLTVCDDKYLRLATEEEKARLFQAIKERGYKWNAETKTLEKLIGSKFDISTLEPFESRVLVRDKNTDKWKSSFWGFYDIDNAMNYPYECCGNSFAQCIPYEGNEHLLGSTTDCDDFYKTWEK